MANALQLRRGTTTQHSTFTGLAGEVTVDTTKDTVVVHDGATAGGIPLATESYVGTEIATEIANLVASAPSTLDTLNELAAALGDDPNFATTVTNSIATKLSKAGGTMTGSVTFNDNAMARFGTGNDLSIYHDGSNSFITDSGTGSLKIVTNTLSVRNAADSLTQLSATEGGAVRLYYSGSEKLATTSDGIDVTGTIALDDRININSSTGFGSIELGGPSGAYIDMKMPFSDDYDARIHYGGTVFDIITIADQSIRLRHNNGPCLATTSTGVDITGTLTTDGVTVDGILQIEPVLEYVPVSSSLTSGTINFAVNAYGIRYYSSNQTADRTINFTNVNSTLAVNQSVTATVITTQGATAYYLNAYQVDGTTVTPKWSGGSAPTGGNANGIDVYTFTIIKTADATFTVLASVTQYA